MRGRLALVLVLLGLIAPSLNGVPAIAQEYKAGDEARVTSLVNGTRSGKGLQGLSTHAGLVNMAREQAVRMLQKGNIFHNPSLGANIQALNVIWKIVGENVGMGPTVDLIEQAGPILVARLRSNQMSHDAGEASDALRALGPAAIPYLHPFADSADQQQRRLVRKLLEELRHRQTRLPADAAPR